MTRKILIVTGAGISVDSGIPTFRHSGEDSIWKKFPPEIYCNFELFSSRGHKDSKFVEEVQQFYQDRKVDLQSKLPNIAHHLCQKMQDQFGAEIITTNIDDLHEKAGSKDVLHLHGDFSSYECVKCGHEWGYDDDVKNCSKCGSYHTKPKIVFFGEPAPKYAEFSEKLQELDDGDTIIFVGMSGDVINPGYWLQNFCPARNMVNTVWINPELPPDHPFYGIYPFSEIIREPASVGLQTIFDRMM